MHVALRIFSTTFGTVFKGHFFHPLLIYVLGHFLGHILGTLFYNFLGHFLWPPSTAVLYLISLKSLISFEKYSTWWDFLHCTWFRVWRLFGYSNVFEYFPVRIFVRIIFVSFFWCEYIRIFIRIVFLIRIYSDIRSYHFFDTNIFGYSFVSFFDSNIFKRKI